MEIIVIILIVLLLTALYLFLGWGVYMVIEEYDYNFKTIDAEDYVFGIIIFWPITAIVLILTGIFEMIWFIRSIFIEKTTK